MKIVITAIALLILCHLLLPPVLANVVINEVELDPLATEPFNEAEQWVELYNSGSEEVDVSDWAVYPIRDPSKGIDIEEGTIISAKGFFVISSSSWLDNEGDSIILKNENGNEIDRTPFLIDTSRDECAWTRYPDGGSEWVFMISSQGRPASGQFCEEKEVEYVRFTMDQSVHGVGFTNTLSSISGQEGKRLNSQEHGSGNYSSENTLGYHSDVQIDNRYIRLSKKNSMDYNETVFRIADAQPINFTSRWASMLRSEESQSSANMQESYRYATNIDGETKIVIGGGISRMVADSEFEGAADIKYISPELKSVEDYTGSFRISENFSEDYFNKSALSTAGYHFLRVEKHIGDNLRTYEHGTGIYMTDEEIRADISKESIAQDITLLYRPVSYSYSPQTTINQSLKWREGIYSKDKDVSFIAEDFSDIQQLKKETVANSSKAINTQASFTGKARFRTDIRGPSGEVHQDDEYYGSYNVARKAIKLPAIDKPHFSITKQGRVSSKRCDILDYSITVFNDGNMTLGPIYVKDTFPSGTQLMDTNLVPLELTSRSANWSLSQLGIGESVTIEARLKITKRTNSTVNRVRAFTIYEEVKRGMARMRRLSASNTSTINITWDGCKPISLSVSMSAIPDKSQSNIVRYRLDIENLAEQNMTVNATVTLPQGMKFLNSTTKPSSINDSEISWPVSNLISGKRKAISFMGEAESNGLFVSKAKVNGYSSDGHELASEYVSTPVLVGKYVEFAGVNASDWLPCSNDPQFRSIEGSDSGTMCCDLW